MQQFPTCLSLNSIWFQYRMWWRTWSDVKRLRYDDKSLEIWCPDKCNECDAQILFIITHLKMLMDAAMPFQYGMRWWTRSDYQSLEMRCWRNRSNAMYSNCRIFFLSLCSKTKYAGCNACWFNSNSTDLKQICNWIRENSKKDVMRWRDPLFPTLC